MRVVDWKKHAANELSCKLGFKYDDDLCRNWFVFGHEMLEQPKLGRDNIRCFWAC
jgi:hypothetical protein